MANLTYDIFSGTLTVSGDKGGLVVAFCQSGFSNWDWHSGAVTSYKPKHSHGGPLPPGFYKILPTKSHHPDGGKFRPAWHAIYKPGSTKFFRTNLYIHPKGTHTDGCIAVPYADFIKISKLIDTDKGGSLIVMGGREGWNKQYA